MSELINVLQSASIRRALIVDDAYDTIPLARDLSGDADQWRQFFDDLRVEDINVLKSIFPAYDEFRADQLSGDDLFLEVIWNKRNILRNEIIEPLFERFNRDKNQDLAYLRTLTTFLANNQITCETRGRAFQTEQCNADLIMIDLFLGSTQDEEAMANAIGGLKRIINSRRANPPIVILMSRSGRLEQKRKEFRDSCGLLESSFRIIRKTELAEEGKLTRVLMRLAEHNKDSLKLAAFLDAWQSGLKNACERTANLIRTLDLADHAQIRQLLLTDEGEPTGSYLVDVFDLVLQHEVERESTIIDTAIFLNSLNSETYPPPYVAGSPDLQSLVCRSLFHNNGRLRLTKPNSSAAAFGDVLRRKPLHDEQPALDQGGTNSSLSDIAVDDVLIVMTPACDLQRMATNQLLLLKGTLIPLTPANWSYKDTPIRTPVYETTTGERFQIIWDLKHFVTVTNDDMKHLLESPQGFHVIARLREAPTLELQQKLLSGLGRVGLISPMPASFAVTVEAYLPDQSKKLFKIDVPALTSNKGVCFTGRIDDEAAHRLVLCEDACEALCDGLRALDLNTVHATTRTAIIKSRSNEDLLVLQKGVDFYGVTESKFKEIILTIPAFGDNLEEKRVIGLFRAKGEWIDTLVLNGGLLSKCGIVLVTSEVG